MPRSALGVLLRYLREERRFSLRNLAQLVDIDHSYIYKLESGDKESPSDEVLARLIKHLKPGTREAEMLRFLAHHPEADVEVTEYSLKEPSVKFEHFASAAIMRFRGARPDPKTLIERVRDIVGN